MEEISCGGRTRRLTLLLEPVPRARKVVVGGLLHVRVRTRGANRDPDLEHRLITARAAGNK
jgi:hypothetical protein